jgi:hypothetical protein
MNVSMTSPLSTATPDSAMKPTAEEIENAMPRSHSAATPPVTASGTALNTRRASRHDPSAPSSSRNIRAKQTGKTIMSRCRAAAKFSNWPAQVK